MAKKAALVIGTRPDIIKMSPLIRLFRKQKRSFFVIHTGQHYSFELDRIFFQELNLPEPEYSLSVKSTAPYEQGRHTGTIMIEVEKILLKELPGVVLVHGDTNSALAGALVTSKISTTKSYTGYSMELGHVEAGLRSYDRTMPEEINRVICDHLSDYLFAPTEHDRKNAEKEGIDPGKLFVTGNTIVDAVEQNLEISRRKGDILKKLGIERNEYALVTAHRQENVDNELKLKSILKGLAMLNRETGLRIIYPMHPRTRKNIERFGVKIPEEITFMEPIGFLDFLQLEANARLAITDSGGIQEECCILKVPCVTIRENTERPSTVEIKANILAGTDAESIVKCCRKMINSGRNWESPFGRGNAAEKISETIF